ncbi:MAG TPA: family 78 glycoside hydrolase catalytic domain, partial [Bacteroidales bacterium]|nr:family 78 glycoside hydrolase catalytic domain [Bacteroidales bacterium]
FAEMLDSDGKLYTDNYRSALSADYYIASSDGVIEWRPTFTFHGYRYVELSGFSPNAKPEINWVKAIVQYSDIKMNGTFTSSDGKLNQLQSNIVWSLRSNFLDIPTDCPQRDERLGWTGDVQVIAPTAIFNFDMYAFWNGYLQSLRQEQFDNGGIPIVVPNVLGKRSSSGWGDVCTILPWELYQRTGDVEVLESNYETMKQWIDFYRLKAKGRNYIPDNTSFSDWLQPFPKTGKSPGMVRRGDTPEDFVNTAYYARSVELTMKSAEVLGKQDDVTKLQLLYDSIQLAFEREFFDADARTTSETETQTQYLLALEFGLLSDEHIPKATQHLMRVIGECDGHLRTGFLGTPILPLVLDKVGETDVMYDIIFKETYPSWFFSINQGATTMWERWDSYTREKGFHKHGMNSFNHYAYGAIGQWLYERVAGIKSLKPGYKEILIAPVPGGPLTSAEASYNSPYGKVCSSWKIERDSFKLKATVPSNTSAKIIIPGEVSEELMLNGAVYHDNSKVKLQESNENGFTLSALPGTYEFESSIKTYQ